MVATPKDLTQKGKMTGGAAHPVPHGNKAKSSPERPRQKREGVNPIGKELKGLFNG